MARKKECTYGVETVLGHTSRDVVVSFKGILIKKGVRRRHNEKECLQEPTSMHNLFLSLASLYLGPDSYEKRETISQPITPPSIQNDILHSASLSTPS